MLIPNHPSSFDRRVGIIDLLEADRYKGTWRTICFDTPFTPDMTVEVFPMTQTVRGGEFPGLRLRNVSHVSFDIRFDEVHFRSEGKDAGADGAHNPERVGWVAYGVRLGDQKASAEFPVLMFPVRLETRIKEVVPSPSDPQKNRDLCVRFYPDQIGVETHEPELTGEEIEAGKAYLTSKKENALGAWRAIALQFGSNRAAWIVKALSPGSTYKAKKAANSWSRAATTTMLPDHFEVFVYIKGEEKPIREGGKPISYELPVLEKPENWSKEAYGMFGQKAKWMYDFKNAVEVGMGVCVPLSTSQAASIDRIIAVGINHHTPPENGQRLVESLIQNHHYTEGMAFLPYGTPTNNTDEVKSGFNSIDTDYGRSFDIEIKNTISRSDRSRSSIMAKALGIDAPIFDHISEAHASHQNEHAEDIRKALFWGTGGAYIWHFLPEEKRSKQGLKNLAAYFSRYVRGYGELPAFRVGDVPYGILPVSKIRKWIGDTPSEKGLHTLFVGRSQDGLFYEWLASANLDVPRLTEDEASGQDPFDTLLQVLSMAPSSVNLYSRKIVDSRLIGWLMESVGEQPGPETLKAWLQSWQQTQNDRKIFLGSVAGVSVEKSIPMLELVAWGDVEPVNLPLVESDVAAQNSLFGELIDRSVTLVQTILKDDYQDYLTLMNDLKGVRVENEIEKNDLQRELVDLLDTQTYRLDAWITSLSTKRLTEMRAKKPKGILIGAYGWVENLKENTSLEGGFIHAPTQNKAAAAAVLNNAFKSFRHLGDANPFWINLSSERVRRALFIMEGCRQGQALEDLLGFQFERDLHNHSLDKYINEFRALFPINAHKVTETKEPSQSVAARNVVDGYKLAITYRDIDNRNTLWDELKEERGEEISGADRSQLSQVLEQLVDAFDGFADVLTYEAAYHLVSDNFDKVSGALNATSGKALPPNLESLRTSVSTVSVSHRVCVLFERPARIPVYRTDPRGAVSPNLYGWFSSLLGPLDKIGCLVQWEEKSERGGEARLQKRKVLLSELALSPLDFLFMCNHPVSEELGREADTKAVKPDEGQETVLGLMIEQFVRSRDNVPPASEIIIQFHKYLDRDGDVNVLGNAIELGQYVLRMLGQSSYLRPDAFTRQSVRALHKSRDFVELRDKYSQVRKIFVERRATLFTAISSKQKIQALRSLVHFGIQGCIHIEKGPKGDATQNGQSLLAQRVAKALIEIDKRTKVADGFDKKAASQYNAAHGAFNKWKSLKAEERSRVQEPGFNDAISTLVKAIQAIMGEDFVVLPDFQIPSDDQFVEAIRQPTTSLLNLEETDAQHRIHSWLDKVAHAHDRVESLQDTMMVTNAWDGAKEVWKLGVAQLPYCGNRRWMGLSHQERKAEPVTGSASKMVASDECRDDGERLASGVQSILFAVSPGFDVHNVSNGKRLSGLLLDAWVEQVPLGTKTTGIAIDCNQPGMQAPQSLLLAVPDKPPNKDSVWNIDDLQDIVFDTMDLAKIRAVDVDALPDMGHLFSGLLLATNKQREYSFDREDAELTVDERFPDRVIP